MTARGRGKGSRPSRAAPGPVVVNERTGLAKDARGRFVSHRTVMARARKGLALSLYAGEPLSPERVSSARAQRARKGERSSKFGLERSDVTASGAHVDLWFHAPWTEGERATVAMVRQLAKAQGATRVQLSAYVLTANVARGPVPLSADFHSDAQRDDAVTAALRRLILGVAENRRRYEAHKDPLRRPVHYILGVRIWREIDAKPLKVTRRSRKKKRRAATLISKRRR